MHYKIWLYFKGGTFLNLFVLLTMPLLLKTCPSRGSLQNIRMCLFKRKTFHDASIKHKRIAMRRKQELETPVETRCRREKNRGNLARKRALESPNDTMSRGDLNRASKAKSEL